MPLRGFSFKKSFPSYGYTHQSPTTQTGQGFLNYGTAVVVEVGNNTSTIAESEIASLHLSVTVAVSVPAFPPAVYKPLLSMVLPILVKTSQS